MITLETGDFKLSHNPGYGHLCTADMFTVCKDGTTDGVFAELQPKKAVPPTEEEKMASPWLSDHAYLHCRMKTSKEIHDAMQNFYCPDGYFIRFWERDDGLWLVSFNAESILASKYAFMEQDEMRKLLTKVAAI